jgi:hypothetical protein
MQRYGLRIVLQPSLEFLELLDDDPPRRTYDAGMRLQSEPAEGEKRADWDDEWTFKPVAWDIDGDGRVEIALGKDPIVSSVYPLARKEPCPRRQRKENQEVLRPQGLDGSEGKGKIVALTAGQHDSPIVVRYGGPRQLPMLLPVAVGLDGVLA